MRRITLWLVLFCLVCFTGCGRGNRDPIKKISLPLGVEIHSLDPRKSTDRGSTQIINMLHEGLMRYDEQGDLDLGLAQSFSIDKSQIEYIFVLRDAQWSDGELITAYDFEYSWKEILKARLLSTNTNLMYFIKNVKKYLRGECDISEVGVEALDEKTLVVTLEHPTPFFLDMLTVSLFKPISERFDQSHPGWDTEISKTLLCSGPFRVRDFHRGSGLVVEKNPFYWNKEIVQLDQIEIAYLPDSQTQAFLFKKGEVDWYGQPFCNFDYEAYENVEKPEPINHTAVFATFWIQVNTGDRVLVNPNIRKAISYAINRKQIVKHVLHNEVVPSYSLIPSAFNLEKTYTIQDKTDDDARQMFYLGLEELGISKEEFPEIQLNFAQIGLNKRVSEVIQRQVKDVLDIDLKLVQRDWKVHIDAVSHGNYQLAAMSWFSSYPDPSYFLMLFEEKNTKDNYSRWENERYTSLMTQLKKEKKIAARLTLIAELDKIVTEEHPVIPLWDFTYSYAKNKKLKNVVISEMGIADFKYANLEEDT